MSNAEDEAATLLPASSRAGQVIAAGLAALEAEAAEAQRVIEKKEKKRAYDRARYERRKTTQHNGSSAGSE